MFLTGAGFSKSHHNTRYFPSALAFFHEKAETRVFQQWLEARAEPHSVLPLYIILRTETSNTLCCGERTYGLLHVK